ncbi:MAG TPA: hypothetical protein VKD43_17340 [Xanthobacteraceae bacterium]|nr:hypothetical protein [Xanthobacteraceae bacterium]
MLLILGIVVAAAGIATIGFGSTISEFSLGTTSIIAGTTALTGGLILIGLSAVVTELGRVGEALRARPAPRPAARPAADTTEPAVAPAPAPAVAASAVAAAPPAPAAVASPRPSPPPNIPMAPRPRPEAPARESRAVEPYPAPPPSAVEVSAAAIERLRSSIPRTERPSRSEASVVADDDEVPLSPNGAGHAGHSASQQARPLSAEPAPEPRVGADERASAAPAETPKGSRLDFLFRSKPAAARPAAQSENFDAFWPADARSGRNGAEPQPRADEIPRYADYASPAQAAPAQPAPVQERRAEPVASESAAAILKSGVVDGMAYTLYADGSIEAKLPHGTVRFGSIGELRSHIESNS